MVAMFLQECDKFFLHDLIKVFTKRLVPIDLLHIPDLIPKLYVFSLNFIENKKVYITLNFLKDN
jgi:hypothetical protein